jgi:hypothetical protein
MGMLITDMQYINVITLLKHNLVTLNMKLNDNFEHSLNKFAERKYILHNNSKIVVPNSYLELKYIQKLHNFHTDTSELINSTFSIKMLIAIALKFVIFTSQVYFEVFHILKFGEFLSETMDCTSICLIILSLPTFLATAWVCSSTSYEVSQKSCPTIYSKYRKVAGCGLNNRGLIPCREAETSVPSNMSTLAVGPLILWVPGSLSPGIKLT